MMMLMVMIFVMKSFESISEEEVMEPTGEWLRWDNMKGFEGRRKELLEHVLNFLKN